MARPQKNGLDYFPLDVDMDQDDKIALIEAQHGVVGFAIVIKLLMKIYKNSYFYEWTEKEQLLFSKRVNVDINLINVVINDCIKWGLFDRNLLESKKILTSKGIQSRYLEAVGRRTKVEIKKEYLLLDEKAVNVYKNLIIVDINHDNEEVSNDINPKSKVKKSKVKSLSNDSVKNVYLTETEKRDCMNKKIYELYLNGIGQISPTIKERLDDLVELYGMEHVIVAINTTIESGGSSIKYVETVAASNLKKKVNDNGTNKRRPGAGATEATDGSEIDWSQGNTEWL